MFIAKYWVLYQMGREIQIGSQNEIIADCQLPIADLLLAAASNVAED